LTKIFGKFFDSCLLRFVIFYQKSTFSSQLPVFVISSVFHQKLNSLESTGNPCRRETTKIVFIVVAEEKQHSTFGKELNITHCLAALAAVRRATWFQVSYFAFIAFMVLLTELFTSSLLYFGVFTSVLTGATLWVSLFLLAVVYS